jgi:hypothetical protein
MRRRKVSGGMSRGVKDAQSMQWRMIPHGCKGLISIGKLAKNVTSTTRKGGSTQRLKSNVMEKSNVVCSNVVFWAQLRQNGLLATFSTLMQRSHSTDLFHLVPNPQ